MQDVEAEENEINKIHAIEYQHIAGHEHMLFQVVSDGSLYLRHLPETTRMGRTITAATFVMITAAFEWEFRKLYPDGITKKDKVIKAEQNIVELLNQLIEEKKGEERKILKFFKKLVGGDNLSGEIIYVGKELGDVIDPFGKYLYMINSEELKYREMGERIAQQRNNFAHGNLDKEFIGLSLLDIMFLQKIVYAMQLRRIGLDDIQIRGAINMLFHMNLYFENDERVKSELIETEKNEKSKDAVVEETFGTEEEEKNDTLPHVTEVLDTNITTDSEEGNEEKKNLLIAFCEKERSRAEIQEYLGIKSERYVREKVIAPLLKTGDLRRTIPDQPKNRNQKYIATKSEMEHAQAILDNNPVLALSPGDLRREGQSLEEYLMTFTDKEQAFYRDYYEDEM